MHEVVDKFVRTAQDNYCSKSINPSKRIYIAPCVASESEAHVGLRQGSSRTATHGNTPFPFFLGSTP